MIHDFNDEVFFKALAGRLGEREARLVAGAVVRAGGRGSVARVFRSSGLSRVTIRDGVKDLDLPDPGTKKDGSRRQRRPGAGRKSRLASEPEICGELRKIVEPNVRGNPESPLVWVSKSLRKLKDALATRGIRVCHVTVANALLHLGFTLQSCVKSHERGSSPCRDAQFRHINTKVEDFLARGVPAISVDAKKKELIGNFKNAGREYHPKGAAPKVEVYDFVTEEGRATPYGIYDIARNEGFVNVGISHDTAEFAVDSIRRWWNVRGRKMYPDARELLVTADGGGSNGSRCRLWKAGLQKLADDLGIDIHVCHFPPGTSKWNRIEHRMFSHISLNWRGRPLTSLKVIVSLIGGTTNRTGLKITARSSRKSYATGKSVPNKEMDALNITRPGDEVPEPLRRWNYRLSPRNR